MTILDLPPSEYRRVPRKPREPILAPYWWVGVLQFCTLYLFGALVHWIFDRLW
jgi:fatty acid desaturase